MRSIQAIGLTAILLTTACGQPSDLSSSASTNLPTITSETASVRQTVAADVEPVPCPTAFPSYPEPLPGETPIPTNTPPPPTPTVDPEGVQVEPGPGGLGSITLPNDPGTILGIFAALPQTIGDYQRVNTSDQPSAMVRYKHSDMAESDSRSTLALSVSDGPGEKPLFPGRIVAPYPNYWRRDGQVFYAYYDRRELLPLDDQYQNCREERRSVHFTFLAMDSIFLFSAEAPTRAALEPLIAAFVQTVKASPPPVPYSTPTPWPTPILKYPPPQNVVTPQLPTATPTTTP